MSGPAVATAPMAAATVVATAVPVLRALRAEDAAAFERMYERMSSTSRYRRYLSVHPRLPEDRVRRLMDVDGVRHVALAARDGDELVAVARYIRSRSEPSRAEVAIEVEDAWHRRGVGGLLLRELAAHAQAAGVEAFTATMSRENQPVFALLRAYSPDVQFAYEGPIAEAVIPLSAVSAKAA